RPRQLLRDGSSVAAERLRKHPVQGSLREVPSRVSSRLSRKEAELWLGQPCRRPPRVRVLHGSPLPRPRRPAALRSAGETPCDLELLQIPRLLLQMSLRSVPLRPVAPLQCNELRRQASRPARARNPDGLQ